MTEMTLPQALELAMTHHRAGRLDFAMDLYQRILQADPDHYNALHLLGALLMQIGRSREAENLIRRSLSIYPDNPGAYCNLGSVLYSLGRLDEAIECLKHAISLSPEIPENHNNIGNAYRDKGMPHEAIASYSKALSLQTDFAQAHNNLGAALYDVGRLDDSIECCKRAIQFKSDMPEAYSNMGNSLKDQGRLKEAIESYRVAIKLNPGCLDAQDGLIMAMQYDADSDDKMIRDGLKAWNDAVAKGRFSLIRPHDNNPDPDRMLKVGFVSPDFRMHPVGRMIIPLLKELDPSRVESHCYYCGGAEDDVTEICRKLSRCWVNAKGLSDAELADQIRADSIDILVDLASHTSGNRLLLFAQKPAPVQATWLAYCGSTGLEKIDYRLSDPLLDPTGSELSLYVEKTQYLASYWIYPQHQEVPDPGPLPRVRNGRVTFGCLNNYCKVSGEIKAAWRQILELIPDARLTIYIDEGMARDHFRRDLGVDPGRIRFVARSGFHEYMKQYLDIDIALDPFPFNGGTTSCDAMWMGVPVVSLVGKRAVSRAGLSVLTQVGMPELAANSAPEYVQKAVELANDIPRLSQIRATLRERMLHSPLMDSRRFASDMETALKNMWRQWIKTRSEVGHG